MALRFHFAPFARATNPGHDVQQRARKSTEAMRANLDRAMGSEAWALDSHVTEMDDGSDFYAVVVSVEHCPDDKRDFDRCQDSVLRAFATSGLDRHMIFDGTDFGPMGPGVPARECPKRGYHFYEREPGERRMSMPQSVVDAERRSVEASLSTGRCPIGAAKGRLLELNPKQVRRGAGLWKMRPEGERTMRFGESESVNAPATAAKKQGPKKKIKATKKHPDANAQEPVDVDRMEHLTREWEELFEEMELAWDDDFEAHFEAAPEFSKRTGLEFLGGGQSRMVFALDEHRVLKLAFYNGVDSNEYECSLWFKLIDEDPESAEKWLAPVVACGGEWLVMERASPVKKKDIPDLSYGSAADQTLHDLGISDASGKPQWGRLPDGRVVLLDYGSWPD